MAQLDERLVRSPVRDGFVERQHFADAAAALWLEGELVHLNDLVLHDAHMDIRTPTHELTRAHAVLRTRRRIFAQKPDWALSRDGFLALTGRGGATPASGQKSREGQGLEPALLKPTVAMMVRTIVWPKNLPRSMPSWPARRKFSAAPTCLVERRKRHNVTGRSRKTA
ncbi:hypothetical protein [Mesorhizobium sp. M0933]|uniref:hypothetical protein n=1 Tax=Mesorhizobium sp. M0933 TaxID=2957030 RepID=UPI00333BE895